MGTASSKLWDGVQANDPIEVVSAIKAGADPNATMQFRRQRGKYDSSETPELTYEIEEWTPLHFACDRGYSQVAYVLLQNGADITRRVYTRWATTMGTKATYEQMAIHLAAKNGHREVLEVLLARSPEHCGTNEHDFSCESGDMSVQRTSSTSLASLIPAPPLGYTPLHLAALHGARQLVELLLFNGALGCAEGSTPIFKFPKGWSPRPGTCTTPLGIALHKGDTDNALLMAHGTELRDPILVHLCMRGQIDCAEFLVQNGSGASNGTLLRRTCANAEQNKPVLAFMCKHYLQMDNTHPNSMLFEACVLGKVGMVQYLLEHATEKDLTDCRYNRLIVRAPGRQQAAVLTDNVTPLHGAVWGGFAESVALLLLGRKGKVCYGVDSTSNGGVTPLHLACILGHSDVALALVRYGGDTTRTTTISFEDTDQLPTSTEYDPSSYTLPAPDSVTTADLTARATKSSSSQGSPVTSRLRLVLNPLINTASRQPLSDTPHDAVSTSGPAGTRSHLIEGPPRNALELAAAFGHASLVELLTEGDNSPAAQSARSMAAQRQQARKVDTVASPTPQNRTVRRISSRDRVATLERTFSGSSETWNGVDGLPALLARLDLSQIEESLRSENINDVETLRLLTRQDLRDLGLKIGDVRRLMRFLNMPDDTGASSGMALQQSDSWQPSALQHAGSGGIPRVGSEPGLRHIPKTRGRSSSKEASAPNSANTARRTMTPTT